MTYRTKPTKGSRSDDEGASLVSRGATWALSILISIAAFPARVVAFAFYVASEAPRRGLAPAWRTGLRLQGWGGKENDHG